MFRRNACKVRFQWYRMTSHWFNYVAMSLIYYALIRFGFPVNGCYVVTLARRVPGRRARLSVQAKEPLPTALRCGAVIYAPSWKGQWLLGWMSDSLSRAGRQTQSVCLIVKCFVRCCNFCRIFVSCCASIRCHYLHADWIRRHKQSKPTLLVVYGRCFIALSITWKQPGLSVRRGY